MLLLGWVLPACSIAAIVLGALAGGFWGGLAVILGSGSMLMQTVALVWTWHIGRQPAWSVLLYPLGTWSVYRAMRWAAQALESGEPVKWGGREYVLKPNE
jgi:hypothetical protein